MLEARFRTLGPWPGKATPSYDRVHGPFKASYQSSLHMLERELRYLNAKDTVIEVDLPVTKIRNDGWPYSDAVPGQPGVVVSFSSRHGPLRLPCDRFLRWEHNLRAIAYHLEHLRMSALYGVGARGEQYRGWNALPPGGRRSLRLMR